VRHGSRVNNLADRCHNQSYGYSSGPFNTAQGIMGMQGHDSYRYCFRKATRSFVIIEYDNKRHAVPCAARSCTVLFDRSLVTRNDRPIFKTFYCGFKHFRPIGIQDFSKFANQRSYGRKTTVVAIGRPLAIAAAASETKVHGQLGNLHRLKEPYLR
jgi:hypothetical protein